MLLSLTSVTVGCRFGPGQHRDEYAYPLDAADPRASTEPAGAGGAQSPRSSTSGS